MGMSAVLCWVVVMSSQGKVYEQFLGREIRETGDNIVVNFYEDFKSRNIISPSVQLVNENECVYVTR